MDVKLVKRPLCLFVMAFIIAIFIGLSIKPIEYEEYYEDDENISMIVTVSDKEYKINSDGEKTLVVYGVVTNGLKAKIYLSDINQVPFIGEKIKIQGIYKSFGNATNLGEFDNKKYNLILGNIFQIQNAKIIGRSYEEDFLKENLYKLKMHFESILDKFLSEDDSMIMKAILLGDKNYIDDETKDLYMSAGIIHILSTSGLHISIIGLGLYNLIRKIRINKIFACIISCIVMLLYGVMCGMATSAARAIIMFFIFIFAKILGRTYDMLNGICIAAFLLLIEQPLYIYHSGFLLSFGAVFGICVIYPCFPNMNFKNKIINSVYQSFMISLSVSIMTLPILINTYYTFSIYSFLWNILIIPCMSVLMCIGLSLMIIGAYIPLISYPLAFACHLILLFYKQICILNKNLDNSTLYIGASNTFQIVIYFAIVTLFVILSRIYEKFNREYKNLKKENENILSVYWQNMYKSADCQKIFTEKINKNLKNSMHGRMAESFRKEKYLEKRCKFLKYRYVVIIFAILILCIRIKPKLRISFIDVGQGNCIVLEDKGQNIIVDAGSTSKKNIGKYKLVPYLKYRGIGYVDAIVVTHEDEDHISGILELIEKSAYNGIKIGELLLPDCAESSREDNYHLLEEKANEFDIAVNYISASDTINTANKDMQITCIGPSKGASFEGANAHSTILYLKYNDFKMLLTGDVEKDGLDALNDFLSKNSSISDITVLQVPHHGSKYTTDEKFLSYLKPKNAIILVGKNSYGHPSVETLERLKNTNASIYTSLSSGQITIETDGTKYCLDEFIKMYTF